MTLETCEVSASLWDMRDLERLSRITARSIPEVIGEMERAVSRYGESRRVEFRARKLSNEAFVNAALIHLLEMEPEDQGRVLTESLAHLEAILAGTDSLRAQGHGPSAGAGGQYRGVADQDLSGGHRDPDKKPIPGEGEDPVPRRRRRR